MHSESVIKRLTKYSERTSDGCLQWNGYKDVYGYGVLLVTSEGQKKNKKAHRLAYEVAFGKVSDGLLVCHKCDNRACIEPSHLFLGTPADNNADMMRKGRNKAGGKPHPGEKNGRALLSARQVLAIRTLKNNFGISGAAIARSLNMSESAVQRAIKGTAWKHLESGIANPAR